MKYLLVLITTLLGDVASNAQLVFLGQLPSAFDLEVRI